MFIISPGVVSGPVNPITFVASATTQNGAAAGTLVIAKPAGTVDGNLMIAIMAANSANPAWTGDTGWTEIFDWSMLRVAYKIAATEGANYTFTLSSAAYIAGGHILTYRNAAYDTVSVDTFFNNPEVAGTVTAAVDYSLLIAAYMDIAAGQTFSTPPGMTPLVSNSDSTAPSWAIFTEGANAGVTGSRSSTVSPNYDFGTSVLIAIKPA